MQSESNTFWVRGYLPNGFNVSFTIATTPETAYDDAMRFTTALLAQGLTIHEPGLEPGQKREAISQIVMGRKEDGTLFMDMYSANAQLVNRMLSRAYFDNDKPELAETFQKFSGYALNQNHKLWTRKGPVVRGESPDDDAYLITLPRPVYAVATVNPDYVEPVGTGTSKIARWKIVRFDPMTDAPPAAPAANPYSPKTDAPKKDTADLTLATTVVIKEDVKKNRYLAVLNAENNPLGVTATRQVFTDAGYDTNSWTGVGTRIQLDPPAVVFTETVNNAFVVTAVAKAA